jgi:hypothetical protein
VVSQAIRRERQFKTHHFNLYIDVGRRFCVFETCPEITLDKQRRTVYLFCVNIGIGEDIQKREHLPSGRNSAVECKLPKLDVEGSIPFARFFDG